MKTVNCINFCANEREVINRANGSIDQSYANEGEFLVINASDIDERTLSQEIRKKLDENLRTRVTAEALQVKARMVEEQQHTL